MKKKKQEKPWFKKIRKSWGNINPWTKVKPSKKVYNRSRDKKVRMDD